MKALLCGIAFVLASAVSMASADDTKTATERIQALSERIARLSSGKIADYAKDKVASAQATLGAAKAAQAVPNAVLALQKVDLANVQLDQAEAVAAEKESAENLLLRRSELRKAEAQFDQLLQAGGK